MVFKIKIMVSFLIKPTFKGCGEIYKIKAAFSKDRRDFLVVGSFFKAHRNTFYQNQARPDSLFEIKVQLFKVTSDFPRGFS